MAAIRRGPAHFAVGMGAVMGRAISLFEQRCFLRLELVGVMGKGAAPYVQSYDANVHTKPARALPHRLVLVADPQLVDPHTYPGRPWPLSTFTVSHTDQYLRRSFQSVLDLLEPTSVIFLGDLFDGGREWSTDHGSKSPEERWNKYGEDFWLNEYARFANIFVDPWAKASASATRTGVDRRFRANLPGNHDLGISNGVQLQVRERFSTYFGEGNMMEVLGNHTVVMVDTVSLTAKAVQDGANPDNQAIWEPASTFVQQVQTQRRVVAGREIQRRKGLFENERLQPIPIDALELHDHLNRPEPDLSKAPDFPALLLTHVPLYRPPGTPCGPLREKYPPTQTSGTPLESDEPNALKVQGGYQYQNVLHPEITQELLGGVGAAGIAHVFSGDDHDYCEVVHRGYSAPGGGVREITVKSMSWAMGVRRPGFLLVSLWNPVDSDGRSMSHEPTVQTHLCLLPDQLGIFIYYAKTIVFTLVVVQAVALVATSRETERWRRESTILPLRSSKGAKDEEDGGAGGDGDSCSSSAHSADGGLTARAMTSRKGMASATVYEKDHRSGYAFSGARAAGAGTDQRPRSRWRTGAQRASKSLCLVAVCALGYYVWLARTV